MATVSKSVYSCYVRTLLLEAGCASCSIVHSQIFGNID